ncbi:MAG: hypothetical protein FWD22_02145 [Treponema sp.]|nr:hypothetical protein [Treponema sp.]
MKNYFLLVGACFILSSCSTPDAANAAQLLGGSSQALLYLNCRAVSQDEVEFEFSQPVTVKHISFQPELSVDSVENGKTVRVKLGEKPESGKLITTEILAEDEKRNTINVLVSFRSRNDRMPDLVINEICTEYANAAAGRKPEFIELKMRSDGNLGAMRVVIRGNTAASRLTTFEFSPVEVKKGDYIVLHLRTYDENNKDEYGDNLAESGGVNASPNARDFWIPGTAKLIHKTSFVYVLDQDDEVIDAVILSEKPDSWWTKDYFAEAAEFLFNKGVWISPEGGICRPEDVVISSGTTNTRTICRDETMEETGTPQAWYITVTSGATPGRLNNPNRYQN